MKQIVYQKVLIPHDGSQVASAILPHVLAIEGGFNAEIILLQVIDSLFQLHARIEPIPTYTPEFNAQVVEQMADYERKAAHHNLEKVKEKLAGYGITRVKILICEGNPGDEIIKVAKKEKIDLIMLSTHGRSGLKRLMLGSVADYVIRHSQCPILTVHPKIK